MHLPHPRHPNYPCPTNYLPAVSHPAHSFPLSHLASVAWNQLLALASLTSTSANGLDHLDDAPEALADQIDAAPTPPAADLRAGTTIDAAVIARP